MVTIDGAQKSGSGTLVRYAVALATLLGQPLRVYNVRAKRPKPGLRAQHVSAIHACAELCQARVDGVSVGGREFTFVPGTRIRGGTFAWDIGTAGSATMLALGILPVACFATSPLTARITGGVFQDFAPSPYHLQYVLAPLLARMGVTVELRVIRAGYVPQGAGVIEMTVKPVTTVLTPLTMVEQGQVQQVTGIALASHLAERKVSERMARTCEQQLTAAGLSCRIERITDTTALHAGACLAVWAKTSTQCYLGADRAGALGRSSEAIGRYVAASLLADLTSGATIDRYGADQLALFAALAQGTSRYLVPRITDHLESNLWLAAQFGARGECRGHEVTITGLGLRRLRC
ncbi:MAG: RNA 3'-terminal phosphate cyclase [Candidatus Binatia bacterium]|nr:RNA 3'-terminal phosphate cyclase [Candidatus Binatia bacterium]